MHWLAAVGSGFGWLTEAPVGNVDLDRLDALFAAATPGERVAVERGGRWHVRTACCINALIAIYDDGANARADAALYSAYQVTRSELRTLRKAADEEEQVHENYMGMLTAALGQRPYSLPDGIDAIVKERDTLRARVAELERKGGE